MLGRTFLRSYFTVLFPNSVNKRYFKSSVTYLRGQKSSVEMNMPQQELKNHQEALAEPFTFVPISTIKQKLLSHDMAFMDGHTCISMDCPMCNFSEASLFINKISGSFICSNCKKSGGWNLFEVYLSSRGKIDLPQDDIMYAGKSTWTTLCNKLIPLDNNYVNSSFLNKLKVPLHLFEGLGARVDLANSEVYFPLMYGKEPVGYKSLKSDLSEETFPFKGAKGIVINSRQKSRALVVAKLSDFLALLHLPLEFDVVCLPHGKQNLPQEILPLFEKYEDLTLWFDNDNISWGNAKMFAKKLSETRCSLIRQWVQCAETVIYFLKIRFIFESEHFIELLLEKFTFSSCNFMFDIALPLPPLLLLKPPLKLLCRNMLRPLENQPAPYNCLKKGYDVLSIVKNAQPVLHSSIVTFANLRDDVLTELYNSDKVSGVKWKRFPTLNAILKGHRRGELTILTGPTGSGKTTFMSEYSLDLACNEVTTLWGSFEIRNQRLAKTMMTQMFSAPLENNLDKFNEWADKFERLPIYFMTFHGQQSLNIVMEAVEHATYVHDVAHVIIDNVQFMLGLSNNEAGFLDRFYRQDALIASFRNFATTFNCHVTLVIHPRKERDAEQLTSNSIFGGAKAAQEADNILIIQHKMSNTSLKLRKFLQVAKNRFSGDLGIMPLEFDKEALSFRTKQK